MVSAIGEGNLWLQNLYPRTDFLLADMRAPATCGLLLGCEAFDRRVGIWAPKSSVHQLCSIIKKILREKKFTNWDNEFTMWHILCIVKGSVWLYKAVLKWNTNIYVGTNSLHTQADDWKLWGLWFIQQISIRILMYSGHCSNHWHSFSIAV